MEQDRVKVAWQCEECGEIHDDEDDARECCMPRIHEVFVCRECGEAYPTEQAATQCCADSDEPVRPDPWALERAGQERLF